jgi:fucose permease
MSSSTSSSRGWCRVVGYAAVAVVGVALVASVVLIGTGHGLIAVIVLCALVVLNAVVLPVVRVLGLGRPAAKSRDAKRDPPA